MKSRFIRKDTDAGKDGRQKKGAAEDEMVSITNSMDMNLSKLQEIGKDRGVSSLCCSPWGHKESDRN